MSRRRTSSTAPSTAFRAHDTTYGASIWHGTDFFMGDMDRGAAKRLAALLNEAEDLVELLANRGGVEHARTKLAFAVAKAMGRQLDFSEAPVTGALL